MKVCLKCGHAFSSDSWVCPACGHEPARDGAFEVLAPAYAHEGGGFKAEYFETLARLEATNFWFRARNELILWALRTYKPDAANFLEVGCGTGFVLSGIVQAHPEMALSGSEIFLAGLAHAASRVPTAHFMQMDARRVPFKDEFDAIGAFDVLEHIEEDEAVLAQLQQALKPAGVLLLTVPQHPWLWSASDDYAHHVRRYTATELEKKILGAGLEVIRSTSFVSTLLPAMMLSRQLQKRSSRDFDPTSEYNISPFVNRSFEGLLRLELLGIRLGLNYPAGGSRLVVARRSR